METTHREVWAGALFCFIMFAAMFAIEATFGRHNAVVFLRSVALAGAVAFFCIGWMMREREKDEPVFEVILDEHERVLREQRHRDAA